jgi:hypothetical protein
MILLEGVSAGLALTGVEPVVIACLPRRPFNSSATMGTPVPSPLT